MIDIRASVTCSLGTVLSATISDEYLQGTGLVKCRGSCEIIATITPSIGASVTFFYAKDGITRKLPRKLRVLSSFADPLRGITRVELGCKLTYLQDKREPLKWKGTDDPENAGYTAEDQKIITLPISAKSVMDKCLDELGIEASNDPLTNKFSVAEFDLSPGYVNVLSDLLVSECFCGYLDQDEKLQIFSLATTAGGGPVLSKGNIIDVGSIGAGQLPGEAVVVSYSTLKLKPPEESTEEDNADPVWERTESSVAYSIDVPYSYIYYGGRVNSTQTYNILETSVVRTYYQDLVTPDGAIKRVKERQTTEETTSLVTAAGGLVTEYLNNGLEFSNQPITKTTLEQYYYNRAGYEVKYIKEVTGSAGFLVGGLGLPFVFSNSDYVTIAWGNTVPLEKEERFTDIIGSRQKTKILSYGPWSESISGQQTIAANRLNFATALEVADYINRFYASRGLALLDSKVMIEPLSEPEQAPTQAEINNARNADGGDPNNGWRTESSEELELALGSDTAQLRIELNMPYAPDDIFSGPSGGPFTAVASDAAAKARNYGRVQNRLLLGNRKGMSIQAAPEKLPSRPFAGFVVNIDGFAASYKANATTWTMNSEGVVASCDALFWGGVGTTGD
jgi:hypothetical protein